MSDSFILFSITEYTFLVKLSEVSPCFSILSDKSTLSAIVSLRSMPILPAIPATLKSPIISALLNEFITFDLL